MYVNSLTCLRVKESESECLKVYSIVRQGCVMSLLFNVYMDVVMRKLKMEMRRMGVRFM